MGPGEEKRGDRKSADDEFEGRDLLVGRLPGSEGKPGAGAEQSPSATMSSQAGAHDEVMREILEAARAILARDALQNAAEQESETAEALKRETAALAQAVEAARGTLAEAAGFAARREEQASSGARVLTEGVAALDTRGTALDKLIRLTGRQAEATARQVNESARQAEAVTQGMAGLEETAQALDGSLGDHAENMSRFNREQRWRPWLTGLAIGAASFIFFVLGAVSQREIDVLSLGDPRHEWNKHVVEHFAPLLAACAAKARLEDKPVGCPLTIVPTRVVAIPLYNDVIMTDVAPEELPDLTLDR